MYATANHGFNNNESANQMIMEQSMLMISPKGGLELNRRNINGIDQNYNPNTYLSTDASRDLSPSRLPFIDQNINSRNTANNTMPIGSTIGLSKDFNTTVVVTSLKTQ